MQFVLILLAAGFYKGAMVVVPGNYASMSLCKQAGETFIENTSGQLSPSGYRCIQAPGAE